MPEPTSKVFQFGEAMVSLDGYIDSARMPAIDELAASRIFDSALLAVEKYTEATQEAGRAETAPAWFQAFSQNFDIYKRDTTAALSTLQSTVSTLQSTVSTLQSTVSTLQSTILAIQVKMEQSEAVSIDRLNRSRALAEAEDV